MPDEVFQLFLKNAFRGNNRTAYTPPGANQVKCSFRICSLDKSFGGRRAPEVQSASPTLSNAPASLELALQLSSHCRPPHDCNRSGLRQMRLLFGLSLVPLLIEKTFLPTQQGSTSLPDKLTLSHTRREP